MTSGGPSPTDERGHEAVPILTVAGMAVEARQEGRWVPLTSGVSFEVRQGEVLGLVGESGCGKSVTSLALMGLLPRGLRVGAGSAMFDGKDLLRLRGNQLRRLRGPRLAMVFQDALRSLNPAFTIGDQIAEAVQTHKGVSRRAAMLKAKEMLELVEIPHAGDRLRDYPYMFSGGMCQRVMLALALSCDPVLLFADEPTTALDVTVQSQLLALLKSLQSEMNLSIVFITHDLGVVAQLCNRVAVMYAGEIVEIGSAEDVFFNPCHPYTAGLLASLPDTSDGGSRQFGYIRGVVPAPGSWPSGCHFAARCDHAVENVCTNDPILLQPSPRAGGLTRCVRADEIALQGVRP